MAARYLRELPEDALTGRRDTWVVLPLPAELGRPEGVYDLRSGAAGRGADGRLYADW